MTSKEIRQQFLDFFRAKGHEIVDSSLVVPFDDPTLMFTNAGMNQFKDVFLATGSRPYLRAADTQKCIRAGGKHNDLDDVGQDTYHHTFFEMLGNWSFGDYFKKEAIEWAWELLTEVWKIPKERLHATYFEGDTAEGLEPDSEAKELWETVTDINPDHIHPGNKKDNFWEMGDTGPCGPCSEIHIDLTPDLSGASLVNAGDARVIEIWNLVFIQFNRATDRRLSPLPAKHVDTGMGFERLCAVLQGMERGDLGGITNYDTDVFTPIFDAIQKRTGAPTYTATLPSDARKEASPEPSRDRKEAIPEPGDGRKEANDHDNTQTMIDVSYRVIADHIRCLTFALTDGATPSNEGRGYVLRRILRRAVRYGRQYMNMREPFLCDLVKPIIDHMADAFPELRTAYGGKNIEHVIEIIRNEEESFGRTFDRGLKLYREAADHARANTNGQISGEAAFKLHDTFGFTIDLTQLMAEEDKLTIDIGEYERLMEEAREKARAGEGKLESLTNRIAPYILKSGRLHDDSAKYSRLELVTRADGFVLFRRDGSISFAGPPKLRAGDDGAIMLESTPFYAEQGGQVGDTGIIETTTGIFTVTATERLDELVFHFGRVVHGRLEVDQSFTATVDQSRRIPTMKNHTSTHILNWALREVLGEHVQQKGSLVDPEKTRFDFSHNKPLTNEELMKIESLCNEQIEADYPVFTKEVDQKEARKINTLRAVFGEKYPDRVRVVSIGAPVTEEDAKSVGADDWLLRSPDDPQWMKHSVEFCGGTHVKKTKEAARFVLISEEGVAKGVRRLVGISGEAASNAIALGNKLLNEAEALAGKPPVAPETQSNARKEAKTQPTLARKATTNQSSDRKGADGKATDPNNENASAPINATSSPPPSQGGAGGGRPQQTSERALSTALPALQKKLADAIIPIRTRHEIQDIIATLQKQSKAQQKKADASSSEAVHSAVETLFNSAKTIGGVTVVVGEVPPANADALRGAIDWVRNKTDASAVLLATASDGKVTLIAGMSKTVVKKGIKAGDLIKEICPIVGGRGGGRPDMAQGGGSEPEKIGEAIEMGKTWITAKLG